MKFERIASIHKLEGTFGCSAEVMCTSPDTSGTLGDQPAARFGTGRSWHRIFLSEAALRIQLMIFLLLLCDFGIARDRRCCC